MTSTEAAPAPPSAAADPVVGRVLFLNPPSYRRDMYTLRDEICFQDVGYVPFPLRLAQTAAIFDAGVASETVVFDANALGIAHEDLEARLPDGPWDLVVTTSAAGLIKDDHQGAEAVKRRYGDDVPVALIETVTSPIYPERVLADFPAYDILVTSQPETVLPALARAGLDPAGVLGLSWRDADGAVHTTDPAPPMSVDDLTALPEMAYELLPMERYTIGYLDVGGRERIVPGVRMRTTRDCPYRCPFCIIGSDPRRGYDAKLRGQSPERVVAELRRLKDDYGIEGVFFWDETFTYDRDRCMALMEAMVEADLDLVWRCLTRVDCLDTEMLDWMYRAGCRQIEFGMESGDPVVRKRLHKGRFTDDEARDLVLHARGLGIQVTCDLIVGMPYETEETLQRTLEFAKYIAADNVHMTVAFPYPGTGFYKMAEDEDLLEIERLYGVKDIYDLMLSDRVRVGAKPVARTRELSTARVAEAWEELRREIDRHYVIENLVKRPDRVLKIIASCRSPREFAQLIPKGMRRLKMLAGLNVRGRARPGADDGAEAPAEDVAAGTGPA